MTIRRVSLGCIFALSAALAAAAHELSITVASTTSTEQSGLFCHILPAFTARTGIQVRVVVLGTGQALDAGRRGDADVVLVHDRAAEDAFVAEGFAAQRSCGGEVRVVQGYRAGDGCGPFTIGGEQLFFPNAGGPARS